MSSRSEKNYFQFTKDRFLFFAILAFVFVSSTALALNKVKIEIPSNIPDILAEEPQPKKYSAIPILSSGEFPVISGQGAIAIDLDSGVILYEKNPDKILLPASTTKIVTALVSLDTFSSTQILTATGTPVVGQKLGLKAGDQFKFEDLLSALLVYSANDAAETLAANYCHPDPSPDNTLNCGREAFVEAMNNKARQFYMNNTSFQNPAGLDGPSQLTTARDLIRISEVAMKNPTFAKAVGTKETEITDITGKIKFRMRNINELLGTVEGVKGVKTGWTENARENLVTYVERDGRRVMIAILGSQDRFGETRELINWIFSNYTWQEVKPE